MLATARRGRPEVEAAAVGLGLRGFGGGGSGSGEGAGGTPEAGGASGGEGRCGESAGQETESGRESSTIGSGCGRLYWPACSDGRCYCYRKMTWQIRLFVALTVSPRGRRSCAIVSHKFRLLLER